MKYEDFYDQPISCQAKVFESLSAEEIYPTKTEIVETPKPHEAATLAHELLHTLTATVKPSAMSRGVISKSMLPSDDGEKPEDENLPILPPFTVEVEIPTIDMSEIPGFTDASQNTLSNSKIQNRQLKKIDCLVSAFDLIKNQTLKNQFRDLLVNESGHRTDRPSENGGWVYQYTGGKSNGKFFFQPVEDQSVRLTGAIDLTNPPDIKNAIVVAWVHTHPYRSYIQDNFNKLQGQGIRVNLPSDYLDSPLYEEEASGPSKQDKDVGERLGIPQIVVYEGIGKFEKPKIYYINRVVGPSNVMSGCR